jgi:hypothetical protein
MRKNGLGCQELMHLGLEQTPTVLLVRLDETEHGLVEKFSADCFCRPGLESLSGEPMTAPQCHFMTQLSFKVRADESLPEPNALV